jgi:peroxiredoxin
MKVLQIGSYAILLNWVLLGIAFLIAMILIKVWLNRSVKVDISKELFDVFSNGLFILLISWKGSLLFLEPLLVIKSPLSLLYFTGGNKGLWIAFLVTILYFINKSRKITTVSVIVQSLLIYSFTVTTVYHFLSLFILEESKSNHLIIGLITAMLLYFTLSKRFTALKMPSLYKKWLKEVRIVEKGINKNIIIVIGLMGLIGWSIYDYITTKPEILRQNIEEAVGPVDTNEFEVGVLEGNKAPDFELQSIDGKTIRLSEMVGKKVILNFWATWCPPCKAEMPHMQEFYKDQNMNGVEILAVNLTTAERNKNDIAPFVEEYGLTFPILLDSQGEIGQTYQAFSIPTTYIIDSSGVIQKKIIGPMDKEMMKELINSVK